MSSRLRTSFLTFVGLLSFASLGEAQIGGWVSANAGYIKPADDSVVQSYSFPFRGESLAADATYPFNGKGSFDIGGGVKVLPNVGVGVAVSRYQDDENASIHFSVPHPIFFNSDATATAPSSQKMEQRDTAVHIEGRYIVKRQNMDFAGFAGPTHFSVTRDVVDDFQFSEALSQSLAYSVAFVSNTLQHEELSAWGWNVGADASYYFSKSFGVGGMFRFARAHVDLPNELSFATSSDKVNVGGFFVGGGFRVRF